MLKGLFLHVFAKVVFVLCTYGIHFFLGKNLSAVEYGVIGVVISIITVNYNFLSNGARQAVSKLLATNEYDEKNVISLGFSYQIMISMILAIVNYCGASFFAEILNAPEMKDYIRISAFMIPFTGIYFISLGTINGLRLFLVEATIVTIYPLLRLTVIPYVKNVFSDSAVGVVMGFFTAAFFCAIGSVVYLLSRKNKYVTRVKKVKMKEFFSNMTNFFTFFTCITIILNIDILFVNALVSKAEYVGYYTGAVNFAKVSYYLLSAIYLVVLPMITKFYHEQKMEQASSTIIVLNNCIALLILPIVSIVGATTKQMLASFYNEEYIYAANTATILMLSQFLIGLFVVINMCISATNDKKFSTEVALGIMIFDFFICFIFTKSIGIEGAAIASLCVGGIGCVISYIKAIKIFGKVFDRTTIKLLISNVIMFIVVKICCTNVEITNLIILFIIYATIYFVYIAIMCLLKQVNIKQMINVLAKK